MSVAKTVIKLYYDVLSPYTWIAFEVLCRYRQRWNINLQFKPFLLSGIMVGSDNRPPGMVFLKSQYMGKDLKRLAEYYQVPLKLAKNPEVVMFQKGSLRCQRLLTAASSICPERVEELSRQLWLRVWSRDEDITAKESLHSACMKTGLSDSLTDQLISATDQQQVKDQLKAITQEALDLGAFGSPYIVAEVNGKPERFFGSDRFEIMAHVIGEKWSGPLPELRAKY